MLKVLQEKGELEAAFKFNTDYTKFSGDEELTLRNVRSFLKEVKSKTKYQVELPDDGHSVTLSKEKAD